MQLLAQSDDAAVREAGKDASSSPRSASASEGEAPASPASPSKGGAAREKPVKVLPCPRCESMNTKFCYYNNYSVTQPRHFCRQCQRYWTAGGTLRNVPVGGGSRKKNRHPRPGEPYLPRPPSSPAAPPPLPNSNFQQMLSFAQLPGLSYNPSSFPAPSFAPMPPMPDLPPSMHAMYGTAPAPAPAPPPLPLPLPLPFYEMAAPQEPVKPEFWSPKPTTSMLLNLGLNNRQSSPKPKNGSPPHGSSTIEEEGSTPTNGYSTSGYEETDTVSSMWHSLHDDTMFQDSMFQLNGDDRC